MSHIISLLNSVDENMRIYRFMEAEHLAEWLVTGKTRLNNPETWPDPFEKFTRENFFPKTKPINYENGKVFALCFSRDGISDALWKIYSPSKNSLRISTTIGALREELALSQELMEGQTFIGKVKYTSGLDIRKKVETITLRKNASTKSIALALMEKRKPFKFEEEIRVISFFSKTKKSNKAYLKFSIDPHKVIDTILMDPRIPKHQEKMYFDYFSSVCKFKNSISKSTIYEKVGKFRNK